MRVFDSRFLPDILVCRQVMGEGVDLQRFSRRVGRGSAVEIAV
jgi:hypothetical protein